MHWAVDAAAQHITGSKVAGIRPVQAQAGVQTRFIKRRSFPLMTQEQMRFRLAIPLRDAFAFAMGWSDLGDGRANDAMRRIMGMLVVDSPEYSEQWRASAKVRACLSEKWPGCFCF